MPLVLKRIRNGTIKFTGKCGPICPTYRQFAVNNAKSRSASSSSVRYGALTVAILVVLQFQIVMAAKEAVNDQRSLYGTYSSGNSSEVDIDAEEQQRLHDILVEDWYDLVRYLVGLGFAIFGLIGLYFHQIASYYFLKRYTDSNGTVRRMGRVLSCEPMSHCPHYPRTPSAATVATTTGKDDNMEQYYDEEEMLDMEEGKTAKVASYSTAYRMFVVYSAEVVARNSICSTCGPSADATVSAEPLVETDYFQWFRTSRPQAVNSRIPLILLKGNPKSACTPELLDSHMRNAFNRKNCHTITLLGLSLILAIAVLLLASVYEILSMPNPDKQRPIGWSILITFTFLFVIAGYVFCKMLFEHFKQKVFLSAIPAPTVLRRKKGGNSEPPAGSYRGADNNSVYEVAETPSGPGQPWKMIQVHQEQQGDPVR
jgi:hypothetical protein